MSDKINIEIICDFDVSVDNIQDINAVARAVLLENSIDDCNANILLTDDATIKDLNNQYRGLNEVTDVLSFSNKYEGQYYGDKNKINYSPDDIKFILPENQKLHVGEVVISIPQTIRQTKNTFESELIKLVAHGFLHLLGYDHMFPEEREIMEILESKAINEVSDIV